ncbi:helix-turn-helix domain-containing protein [Hymenobacter daeguensis]
MSQQRPEPLATSANEELLSIKAAAEMLKVSVATIHEYKRRGLLPYVKLAGRAFIRRSDVLASVTLHQRSQKPARTK